MAYFMGYSISGEARTANIQEWYRPACNLHHTPYRGRNYEYYSEDPCLSSVMVSYTVIGAKEQGLYSYVKHFAVNETETIQTASYIWLTKQALRGNCLKLFQSAVKKGSTLAIMSSHNRIGSTRTSGSYNLLAAVLRKNGDSKNVPFLIITTISLSFVQMKLSRLEMI